ncbi:MAG: MerC domain-containing protein [Acidobacteriota bacterium]|nr:MerC domain-containing protein [Acidobacteriota bacterium]
MKVSTKIDNLGAAMSWICAAHCVFLPLGASFLPLVGLSFFTDEKVEWLLLAASLLIAALSLLPAYFRQHKKIHTLVFFASGVSLVIIAHHVFEDAPIYQIPFVVFGAGLITAAHLLNRHLCRCCAVCKSHQQDQK